MRKLLFIVFLAIGFTSFGQGNWTLSAARNRWAKGIGFSTVDTTTYTNGSDTILIAFNRAGRPIYKYLTYWYAFAVQGDTLSDTRWVRLQTANMFQQTGKIWVSDTIRSGRMFRAAKFYGDSLQATSSGGFGFYSNGVTKAFDFGGGGGSQVNFYGFAGMDYNRSGSMTTNSFTPKVYVDSSLLLKLNISDTAAMLSNRLKISDTTTMLSKYARTNLANVLTNSNLLVPSGLVNTGGLTVTNSGTVGGDFDVTGNLTAASGFFAASATGNVGSVSNTSILGSGLFVRGGSDKDKSPLVVRGWNNDSIFNATLTAVYLYKPIVTTTIGQFGGLTVSGNINASTLTTTGTGTFGGGTQILGGAGGANTINYNGTYGLYLNGGTGSLYDLTLTNRSGSSALGIKTNSQNLQAFNNLSVVGIVDAAGLTVTGAVTANTSIDLNKNQNASTQIAVTNTDNTNTSSRAIFNSTSGSVITQLASISTLGGFIGTASNHPAAIITNGNSRITVSSAGAIQFNTYGAGTLTTDASGNITASSDTTMKNLIKPLDTVLNKIMEFKPYYFKWKNSTGLDTSNVYLSTTAQSIGKSFPLALGRSKDGTLTVQDRAVLAITIKAVQELKLENDNKQLQIDNLRAQLDEIKALLKKNNIQ